MQVQKEEIREKIINVAMDEFSIKGYQQVSMRNIARKVGITAGDIYAYFSSKEYLLKYLIDNAVSELQELTHDDVLLESLRSEKHLDEFAHKLARKYIEIRKSFLMLIKGCEGSRFESVRVSLIEGASKKLIAIFSEKLLNRKYLSEAIAVSLIQGIIYIFRQHNGNYELFSTILSDYLKLMLGSLYRKE